VFAFIAHFFYGKADEAISGKFNEIFDDLNRDIV
jgi:hypothetical protein